ncbi:hypothetical protein ACL00Q_06245 [Curtobacterium flaccumfaciens pv. flaccumfaciens]|uniref:hypothetical protein n=1 Tax=Curtobacterium flaccumfaciens TaxID=2035 RepID=UPI0039A1CD4E
MRSVPALLLPAIAGVLLLAGCAGPPPVDEAALHAWEKRQRAVEPDAELGVLFAAVSPGDDDSDDPGTGVTITFPHPEPVDHLEFSCFGDGHMRAAFTIGSAGAAQTQPTEPMSCRDGAQRIDLPPELRRRADSVSFNGFDSDRDSAWYVRIIATDPDQD